MPRTGVIDPVTAMKFPALALIAAVVTPLHAETREAPPASDFRNAFIAQCISQGGSNADADVARRSCGCAFDVVARGMTLQEFIDMDGAGRHGVNLERFPQFTRIKTELEACKPTH